jgi:ABC-type amino acid transport substrate-binding protein
MVKKLLIQLLILISIILINSCSNDQTGSNNQLIVGVSADYPPFEFKEGEEFKGLDIDLAKLIGQELNKKIIFRDLGQSSLCAALNSGQVDLIISAFSFTKQRNKCLDLSNPYYFADIALIFRKDKPIQDIAELHHKKVGVQLGTTMEDWAIELFKDIKLITMDLNTQLIEALKSKQLDTVIIEYAQAREFCNKNKDLGYLVAAKSNNGYVVVMKKGSLLLPLINKAIDEIKQQGELLKLEKQWLEVIVETDLHDAS